MTRNQEISAETQRRLIEGAMALAAEGGAEAMSIQAVADRCGISRGSISFHFGSKDGLVVAVVDEAFRWARQYLQDRFRQVNPRNVDLLVDALSDLMREQRSRVFASLVVEAMRPGSAIRDTYAANYVAIRAMFVEFLEEVAPDLEGIDSIAVALLGATLGINIQDRLAPSDIDRAAAFQVLKRLCAPVAPS
jgi:TetR/AcrR family acrAB operon transcriptional repressor